MGGSIYGNVLVLRKEPFGRCASTLEAVGRCLGVIEPHGDEIQGIFIGIVVRLQSGFLKRLKPRSKMLKSNHKEENNNELESQSSGQTNIGTGMKRVKTNQRNKGCVCLVQPLREFRNKKPSYPCQLRK